MNSSPCRRTGGYKYILFVCCQIQSIEFWAEPTQHLCHTLHWTDKRYSKWKSRHWQRTSHHRTDRSEALDWLLLLSSLSIPVLISLSKNAINNVHRKHQLLWWSWPIRYSMSGQRIFLLWSRRHRLAWSLINCKRVISTRRPPSNLLIIFHRYAIHPWPLNDKTLATCTQSIDLQSLWFAFFSSRIDNSMDLMIQLPQRQQQHCCSNMNWPRPRWRTRGKPSVHEK